MKLDKLKVGINNIWEKKEKKKKINSKQDINIIMETIKSLDSGKIRVTEKIKGKWIVNQWVKKAVLLSFQVTKQELIANAPGKSFWWDKVPSKFEGWKKKDFSKANFRIVPNAVVRRGSFIDKDAVIMPSFVNIGAYVGSATMIDTWATVGSCAQIGKKCHISGGAASCIALKDSGLLLRSISIASSQIAFKPCTMCVARIAHGVKKI